MKKIKKIAVLLFSVFLLIGLLPGCGSGSEETIRIVHKNYTEQRLMGQVLSLYLESKGYQTTVSELGGTMLCFNAIKNGEADIYPEYTGTAYSAILGKTDILPADDTYNYVKSEFAAQHDITWLEPLGFNNTYVLSVTSETAEKYNLKTISDLISCSSDMVIGSDTEFANRPDGYPGLLAAYPGLTFKKSVTMDQGLTYQALKTGDLDVNVSFATDGRIAKFNLVNLEDDASFFPPYYCAPIGRNDCFSAHPELAAELEKLGGIWSDEDMQKYNLMVDEGTDAKTVANQMLTEAGLI
jgi:osmoprotectant transport system substrate-binding protein